MIDVNFKPPNSEGFTVREQVNELLSYLFDMAGELNRMVEQINASSFEQRPTGTANDVASGSARKVLTPPGDMAMGGNRITGLPMPSRPDEAATVAFVRQMLGGK